ncbi:Heterotrimeric G-protein alpha subunit [Mycena sanguinolenta]|uniref:Heterotrimeric G-protein alpha subunit n=1 Tax=Mycena sanguinolenta TaxID=230812 RepID=A0A8H6XBB7_9AGAR|nr:Heterotrimeric G-protein alpha subunit [Mycena sanguinolenta]
MKIIYEAGFENRHARAQEHRMTIDKNGLGGGAGAGCAWGWGGSGVVTRADERGGHAERGYSRDRERDRERVHRAARARLLLWRTDPQLVLWPGETGRVSACPTTVETRTPVSDVFAQTHAVLTPALADAIWHVTRVPAVERLVDEHPAEFYLMDGAGYFFSSIHRIAASTYVLSEEDVRARAKSTAIIETRFWMGDLMIHMFDVGGQRSEGKKWIHCFESAHPSRAAVCANAQCVSGAPMQYV